MNNKIGNRKMNMNRSGSNSNRVSFAQTKINNNK